MPSSTRTAFKSQPGPEDHPRVDAAVKDKKTDLDIILALQEVVIDEVEDWLISR